MKSKNMAEKKKEIERKTRGKTRRWSINPKLYEMANKQKENEIEEVFEKVLYTNMKKPYCKEDIITGIKLGIEQGSLSKEKDVLKLIDEIDMEHKLFKEGYIKGIEDKEKEMLDEFEKMIADKIKEIKIEYDIEHKIMLENNDKQGKLINGRYWGQQNMCMQLAYGIVKLKELKQKLEGLK